jgi:hypothetical protein
VLILSGLFPLPRGDRPVGVFARFVGVLARPEGLRGLWTGFDSFPFVSFFPANGELARVEAMLEESEEPLNRFVALGSRDDDGWSEGLRGFEL